MAVSNGVAHESSHLYMQIATDDSTFDTIRDEDEVVKKSCCQEFVETTCFQMVIGAVIAANAIVIGMETDIHDPQHSHLWQELEDAFLAVFLVELMLKLCVYGCGGFFRLSNPDLAWNVFDFVIVSLGVTDRICSHISTSRGSGARFFVLLMRTFRLLRLLRLFRLFRIMKQLYLLAHSMMEAASAVVWVSVLCVMILYVCAIVITRLVGQPSADEEDSNPLINEFRIEHFGSVPTSMLSLFRLMAFPDMERFKPVSAIMPGMECFLISFIILMAFGMVSLLTGVITESLLDKGKKREDERRFERERSRRLLAEDLRRTFQERAGTRGDLNRAQFEKCKEEVIQTCSQHSMRLRSKDLDALFELVDDGTGIIDAEELLYGMVQLNSDVRPMAIMELRRLVVRGIHGISEQIKDMDGRMNKMDTRMIELQAAARFGALAPPASTSFSSAMPPSPPAPIAPLAAPPSLASLAPVAAGTSAMMPPQVDLLGALGGTPQ